MGAFWLRFREKDGANSLVENLLESLLGQRRTLDVAHRTYFARHCEALLVLYGRLAFLAQTLDRLRVITHILLGAHQHNRCARTMVSHLGEPLESNR